MGFVSIRSYGVGWSTGFRTLGVDKIVGIMRLLSTKQMHVLQRVHSTIRLYTVGEIREYRMGAGKSQTLL